MTSRIVTVRLTPQQVDVLIDAGAYYETLLEDAADQRPIGVLSRALAALAAADAKAHS